MAKNKYDVWIFIISIACAIILLAIASKLAMVLGIGLAIGGLIYATVGYRNDSEDAIYRGLIIAGIGVTLAISGKITYDFLDKQGFIGWAKSIFNIS